MTKATALAALSNVDFPSQGIIYDRAGIPVDATGWVWKPNQFSGRGNFNFARLHLANDFLLSVALFIAERLKVTSSIDAMNAFEALLFLQKSYTLRTAADTGRELEPAFFAELRNVENLQVWRLHHIRAWYRWCAQQRLPQFSMETAALLDDLVIGGNVKGHAVRTRDPIAGAFDDLEFIALRVKLRAAGADVLSTLERALVWLAIAFGRNPLAYALMREEDYHPIKEVGTDRIYHQFEIPRIKKGDDLYRTQFDTKMPNAEIGSAVAALIAENRETRAAAGWPDGCALPLFPRGKPQAGLLNGPQHAYAMHMTAQEITATLKRAVKKLGVDSHRTGEPLRANARRFRRTFGTRMVEEGASPEELAIGLDHEDLQNVWHYFETRSSQVERLDTALALKLGPIGNAFMGRIVENESDAVNGDNPAKRIPWFRRRPGSVPERNGNLGTCGSGPCALLAPLSCYTCERFQPWKDGPHREVLNWLCAEREREEKAGLDKQIVGLHDATILAVAKVVTVCEGASQ